MHTLVAISKLSGFKNRAHEFKRGKVRQCGKNWRERERHHGVDMTKTFVLHAWIKLKMCIFLSKEN